jgi:hypothetical protein
MVFWGDVCEDYLEPLGVTPEVFKTLPVVVTAEDGDRATGSARTSMRSAASWPSQPRPSLASGPIRCGRGSLNRTGCDYSVGFGTIFQWRELG